MLSLDELITYQKFMRLVGDRDVRRYPPNYLLCESDKELKYAGGQTVSFEPFKDPRTGEILHRVISSAEYGS